jgi:AraC-like DNA-binding protein
VCLEFHETVHGLSDQILPVEYREIRPRPLLSKFIECFWTLEGDAGSEPAQPQRILPDGCAELILNSGAPFEEHRESGERSRQPMRFLIGQITRPLLISPTGRVQIVGIRFHPGGSLPFFRLPMHEATDRVVNLGGLDAEWERAIAARSGEAATLLEHVAIAEELLLERICSGLNHSKLWLVVAKIVDCGGQISVERLAFDAGVSRRQLERRFLSEVGIGPKLLCRILRFQQVFRAMERNDATWAGIAAACGYYDQAHLIRDCQEFAGETPSALFRQRDELTEFFTRKNRPSHFSNTP